MSAPYRDAGPADPLARIQALPPRSRLHAVLSALIVYRPWPGEVEARKGLPEAAETAGLRRLGSSFEWFLASILTSQVWADGDGVTQARLSNRGYWFTTYFESGRCIITWDHPPRTRSSERLESRQGKGGDFARDYADHLKTVEAWRERGEVPIVVRDVRTATALGRHYYRFVASARTQVALLSGPVIFAVAFLLAVWLVRRPH